MKKIKQGSLFDRIERHQSVPDARDPQRLQSEREARDSALDGLEDARDELISEAKRVALEIHARHGRVTSTDVFVQLRREGFGDELDSVDRRFMGAVFRVGFGWRRVGYEPIGSHGRPVAVWTR